jgi:hypothetical protein
VRAITEVQGENEMTHADQHRMIVELEDHFAKMSRRDAEMFDGFRKRDRDDEDLDLISQGTLKQMYAKYIERA